MAQCFANSNVPHVIAISGSKNVLDDRAIVFSSTLYCELLSGKSVKVAFENARVRVSLADLSCDETADEKSMSQFLLMGEGDHDEVLFKGDGDSGGGEFVDVSVVGPKVYDPPAPNAQTVGQRITIQVSCTVQCSIIMWKGGGESLLGILSAVSLYTRSALIVFFLPALETLFPHCEFSWLRG